MGSKQNQTNNGENNLMKGLMGRKTHVVHLTHNDLDAVGGDAIHRMHHGKVFTIWSSVGKFPHLFGVIAGAPGKGDLLSISDLGYHTGMETKIKKARSNGWRIEWRDHHRWTDEERDLVAGMVDLLEIDTSVCATAIVARDLMPGDAQAREIAKVVCDYDLWKHEDPRSKVLGQVCTRKKNREYVRDRLVEGKITDAKIEEEYADISRERDEAIRMSIKHAKVYTGRYTVAFAPLYGYPSETAHAIRDALNTDIEVIVSSNGRFSIRSVPPVSHLIARKFGGGGHPPAAGGNFDFNLPDRIFFFLLKRTKHYRKLVAIADEF